MRPRDRDDGQGWGEVHLGLLHGFELTTRGELVTLPVSAQRLLALLALQAHQLQRVYVAGTLWIDASEARSGANLRTALWRLRRAGGDIVDARGAHLRLAPSVVVDVRSAIAQARRIIAADGPLDESDAAPAALTVDLLPDWYDDWILIERERFRQIRLHALETLCVRLSAAGRFAAAVEAGVAAVASEPLRESAQRALIGAHIAEGNTCEALRQLELYRVLLSDQLGLEPSPLVQDLVSGALAARAL
jgi:DNA-binding SARP family transcriptional activator